MAEWRPVDGLKRDATVVAARDVVVETFCSAAAEPAIDQLARRLLEAVRTAARGRPERWIDVEQALPFRLADDPLCQQALWRGFELGWFKLAGWGTVHSVALRPSAAADSLTH